MRLKMNMESKIEGVNPKVLYETEPIYNLRIEFCDGSNPIEHFNLGIESVLDVIRNLNEDWIIILDEFSPAKNNTWLLHANVRHGRKPKVHAPEEEEEDLPEEPGSEFVPDLEYTEPGE